MAENFDLKKCLSCFNEFSIQKFGRQLHFEEIENKISKLNNSNKALSHKHLKILSNKKYWDFEKYWTIPKKSETKKPLKNTRGLFKDLPNNEKNTIDILYKILKNIEVVSIVLRFINPFHYGIISPPVRNILKLTQAPDYVTDYINYLIKIREYSNKFGFERVADVDMALWALSEKCVNGENKSCSNYNLFCELLEEIEYEIIKKSESIKKIEEDILREAEIYASSHSKEIIELKYEKETLIKEIESLKENQKFFTNLINLPDSNNAPEKKIQISKKEPYLDSGHEYFLKKLSEHPKIDKIIWSENIRAKRPSRISNIGDKGELTILYITKDDYAVKIKVYPAGDLDKTHSKYFNNLIAKYMNIKKYER